MTVIQRILPAGKKELPKGTKVKIQGLPIPGWVDLWVTLPGQSKETYYPRVRIEGDTIRLPVPMTFLSYAKEDADYVRDVANRLFEDGVMTWFDEKDLLPGDDWKAKIDQAIDVCDFVLVFLSPRSVDKTGYFQREMRYALEQRDLRPEGKRFIIPVLLQKCEPPQSFKKLQWLDSTSNGWYAKLQRAITL